MSVLFPLFFAAAAAVVAPILLHLLRNRARNIQVFSSLMFLRASPPRMQPKTRVENLPLLLLRCLALILLAIAFARPWWPTADLASGGQSGRTLVLIDTSASMSRSGLWDQALAFLDEAVADPEQRVAVIAFDRSLRHLVDFEDWAGRPAATRADHARSRVRTITPGSAGTDLGLALAGAVELISEDETAVREVAGAKRIILISDLQAGRGLDALRTATWPDGLELSIRQVSSTQPTNAGLSLVGSAPGVAQDDDDRRPRVRVSNDSGSKSQAFTIGWTDGVGTSVSVNVPPGSSRVVRAPARPADKPGFALVLRGDDHAFDNTVYLTDTAPAEVPVLYLGNDSLDDPNGLSYFLNHALQPTRALAPRLSINGLGNQAEALSHFSWVVVGGAPSVAMAEQLGAHVRDGGAITVVLRQASDAAWLENLSGQSLRAEEATISGHAMIGRVDFTHPLLRPFDAAQFGDFTKIHVWHQRTLTPPPSAHVLAWYDDGAAAWFELSVGKGRVLVMTSGWNPTDSQLALSTKFVPLIYTELQRSSRIVPRPTQVIIGDQATMPTEAQTLVGPLDPTNRAIPSATTPAANPPRAGDSSAALAIERQGIYRLQTTEGAVLLAANLDPLESHTAPLARETLEAIGVKVARTTAASAAEAAAAERQAQRQLQVAEIERRQKSWLWILVAVLVVLLIETVVASYATTSKSADTAIAAQPMQVASSGVAS
jgi:Aerotolerance regulator N-terminal/von Willebrand factor type A domain